MKLITCKNGHRYDPELTPECPECALLDFGGLDFDTDFPDLGDDFLRQEETKQGTAEPENNESVMRTCEKGHWYDASLTKECPLCALGEADEEPAEEPAARVVTCRNGHRYDPDLTPECPECALLVDVMEEFTFDDTPEDNTVPLPKITGWLVGIGGPAWGKSFELHEECSYIGSGPGNEISNPQDAALAEEKDCVIAYDDVDRRFYVGMGQGKSILRLNDRPVLMTQELKKGDRLKIGAGTYLFVPLCGETFDWKDYPRST